MNQLSVQRRAELYRLLMEGNSVRACNRITDVHTATIMSLIRDLGLLTSWLHRQLVRGLPCKRVQCDEIQSQVGCAAHRVWTWTAICIDTRLIVAWRLGDRTLHSARPFMLDLRARTSGRMHVSTDQLSSYPRAVAEAFGADVDYAAICIDHEGGRKPEVATILGNPDTSIVNNAYVERHNRTMRESMHRFSRRTHGYSRLMSHHEATLASYFVFYNFCRPNMALRNSFPLKWPKTPAMAAGLTDRMWSLEEVCALLDPAKCTVGAPFQWKLDMAPRYRIAIPNPAARRTAGVA